MKATNTLKELKKDFELNKGYELGIKGVGHFEITEDMVYVSDLKELEKVIEVIRDFEDYGKCRYDGHRADFYFKNGIRALSIFNRSFSFADKEQQVFKS